MGNACQKLTMDEKFNKNKTIKVSGVSQLLREQFTKAFQSNDPNINSTRFSGDVNRLFVCPDGEDHVLVEFANDIPDPTDASTKDDTLKIDGTELKVEHWTASTHSSPEFVSKIWLTDGSTKTDIAAEQIIVPRDNKTLPNSTDKNKQSNNVRKFGKEARQNEIDNRRGLNSDQPTTPKLPFDETRVKLNDDLVKKLQKDERSKKLFNEIADKEEVIVDEKGGFFLTGAWDAIDAVRQTIIDFVYGSDQTKNNYDPVNNFTASPEATDPSTATEQLFTVSLLFFRYVMAYHYEVFQHLESVCKEIGFEVKSETEKNLKLIPREDVDPNKFFKTLDKFIDFYQGQNPKMQQQDIAKPPKDVLSEARTKFSVVIDSTREPDKITIYGEKDKVEEAKKFFQSKIGVLNPGSSSSKPKTKDKVVLTETFSSDLSENLKLFVYQGDLTKENVDAIVNPANDLLQHGGGAAWAIVKAGGKTIQDESDDIMKKRGKRPLQPGEVELTSGGRLPCNFVVHAVGPIWNHYPPNTAMQLLYNAVFNSLSLASRNGAKSISIPAISSGVYKAPVDICAQVLFDAVIYFATKPCSLREIHFVNIDSSTNRAFVKEMEKRFRGFFKREKIDVNLPKDTNVQERQTPTGQRQTAGFTTVNAGTNSNRDSKANVNHMSGSYNNYRGDGASTNSNRDSKANVNHMGSSHKNHRSDSAGTNSNRDSKANVNHMGSSHNNDRGDDQGAGGRRPSDKTPTLASYAEAAAEKKPNTDTDQIRTIDGKKSKDDECSICLSEFTKKKTLDKCGHSFCTKCINRAFKVKKQCPLCFMVYGPLTGCQPKGNMYDSYQSTSLPGFSSCGTIVISYRFASGTQGPDHPNPGKPYSGTSRTAYLPHNDEGKKVLKLLKKAFEQKLTFTIGRSTTTGRDDCVTWNDIHHKTAMYGGPTVYGYPDSDYLKRVQDELAAKGITE